MESKEPLCGQSLIRFWFDLPPPSDFQNLYKLLTWAARRLPCLPETGPANSCNRLAQHDFCRRISLSSNVVVSSHQGRSSAPSQVVARQRTSRPLPILWWCCLTRQRQHPKLQSPQKMRSVHVVHRGISLTNTQNLRQSLLLPWISK